MTQASAPLSLQHLQTMTGPLGLYQHATIRTPLLREGYCTDDNARAITTLLYLRPHLSSPQQASAESVINLAWQFIADSRRADGTYYNFRAATDEWLTTTESEDMYARLIRACAVTLQRDADTHRKKIAAEHLTALLTQAHAFTAVRAIAETAVALRALSTEWETQVTPLRTKLAALLLQAWREHASDSWPWFENALTYANALLPHGLLALKPYDSSPRLRKALQASTDFLIATTIKNDMFIPIGSDGWYPRYGTPSQSNQQPIEAAAMLDFLLDYHREVSPISSAQLTAPYRWLFGHNTHNFSLVDLSTGACRDGLLAGKPNYNCGAESLLAYLFAEARQRQLLQD
ncbi:MAG TPA: hypothetical protein VJC05_02045 [Candidatus Andersenbacteria bacterium]|nr:hypothetical protein [Candidatus Andersenbacteria bacterium]